MGWNLDLWGARSGPQEWMTCRKQTMRHLTPTNTQWGGDLLPTPSDVVTCYQHPVTWWPATNMHWNEEQIAFVNAPANCKVCTPLISTKRTLYHTPLVGECVGSLKAPPLQTIRCVLCTVQHRDLLKPCVLIMKLKMQFIIVKITKINIRIVKTLDANAVKQKNWK